MSLLLERLHLGNDLPVSVSLLVSGIVFYILYSVYNSISGERAWPQFEVITVDGLTPKMSWMTKGTEVLRRGLAKHPEGIFQIMTGTGPKLVLSNKYTDELRNEKRMSFNEAFKPDFFHSIPGFDGMAATDRAGTVVTDTVRIKLTQSLGLVTEDLVEETRLAIAEIFATHPDWHTSNLKEPILNLVARLSSRVFLGPELCRNKRWLEISKGYTIDVFGAARELRKVPSWSRWFMHWFIPACRHLREEVRDAHALIDGEVERRRIATQKIIAAGGKAPKVSDAIGWMVEMAKGKKVDLVGMQLSLSMAAIHTTTETITMFLIDLIEHPEYTEDLRQEVISVVKEHGLSRTALYQLRLMDSFLKESQRIHRPFGAIQRGVTGSGNFTLSDGTKIPNKSRIMILSEHTSPRLYPEPLQFDARRFLRMRDEPGQNNSHQFVTTSSEHFGFGHGEHACPGRFFASNEIKIVLCHLLLKYDFRFEPGKPQMNFLEMEAAIMTSPFANFQFKSRQPEIEV